MIFAAGIGPGSKSKRPIETVTPLADKLKQSATLITDYLKDDLQPLMQAVLSQHGAVLISWEHKRIPDLVSLLPNAPQHPAVWPEDRFDLLWLFDRTDQGWEFSQLPQLLLAGDNAEPIT